MLAGVGPVWQALLGTLFTWGLTAAGSALVFVFHGGQVSHYNEDLDYSETSGHTVCLN